MAAILSLLAALLPLVSNLVSFFLSPEQITKREAEHADSQLQDYKKALANNDAAYIDGACADQHDRVRRALRGG